MTTIFLEHDTFSFSKFLRSQDLAELLKQVVKESYPVIHPKCNDGENNKGEINVDI